MAKREYQNYKDWKRRAPYGSPMPGYIYRELAFEQICGLLLLFVVLPGACVWQDGLPYREAYWPDEAERQAIIDAVNDCQHRVTARVNRNNGYVQQLHQGWDQCVKDIYPPAEAKAFRRGHWRIIWFPKKDYR